MNHQTSGVWCQAVEKSPTFRRELWKQLGGLISALKVSTFSGLQSNATISLAQQTCLCHGTSPTSVHPQKLLQGAGRPSRTGFRDTQGEEVRLLKRNSVHTALAKTPCICQRLMGKWWILLSLQLSCCLIVQTLPFQCSKMVNRLCETDLHERAKTVEKSHTAPPYSCLLINKSNRSYSLVRLNRIAALIWLLNHCTATIKLVGNATFWKCNKEIQ